MQNDKSLFGRSTATGRTQAAIAGSAVAALLAVAPTVMGANLVINGSFEEPTTILPAFSGGFTTLAAGNTSINGWTVANESGFVNGVDWIESFWTPQNGLRSLDLNGIGSPLAVGNGGISQNVTLVAFQEYELSFWMAGNLGNGAVEKFLTVSIDGETDNFEFLPNTIINTNSSLGWLKKTFIFTANSSGSTPLKFLDTTANSGSWGSALDNVSLVAIPEPQVIISLIAVSGVLLIRRSQGAAL